MLLSCRILENAQGVNAFDYVEAARLTEGDTPSVYFQLVDITKDAPVGRRFIPATGATLQITLAHINDAKQVVRTATQPFAQDPSIWKFDILTSDVLRGTVTLRLKLTEGSRVTKGMRKAAILVHPSE